MQKLQALALLIEYIPLQQGLRQLYGSMAHSGSKTH